VFTMYEGWDAGKKNRSTLVGKTMLAGMEKSREFHEKREALIRKKYNADETPADEVVRVRSKSSCESALPEREPGIN